MTQPSARAKLGQSLPPQRRDADAATLLSARLLTVEEVAAYLNVPKRWVYDRVQRQELPVVRLGGHLRFMPSEIARYLKQCCDNGR